MSTIYKNGTPYLGITQAQDMSVQVGDNTLNLQSAIQNILRSFAPIENNPVSKSYSIGQYLIFNGSLYKVISEIPQNGTLIINSNVQIANITQALKNLKDAAFYNVANDLTTQSEGFLLDARQGKNLNDNIALLKTDTTNLKNTTLKGKKEGGYWGIVSPDGTNNEWIRTPSQGLLPSTQNTTSGSGYVGASTWPFVCVYSKDFNLNGTSLKNAIRNITRSGTTFTATKMDGTTFTFTQQDNNTTYSANNGVSLSGTTFSNSGVRSISTGSANGTISVNTNGTAANVAVKGLGTAAYTNSGAYAAASHSHSYLPLSGGTVTGAFTATGGNITCDRNAATQAAIRAMNSVTEVMLNCTAGGGCGLYHYKDRGFKTDGWLISMNNTNGKVTVATTVSDERRKKNIANTKVNNALDQICQIQMREFDWKDTNIHNDCGFIAQEVYKINPNFAIQPMDEPDTQDWWHIDDFYMLGMTVKAVQQLNEKVNKLEARIKELENQNNK